MANENHSKLREILFRGKSEYNGEWFFGSLHSEYGETDRNGNRKTDYRILGMRGECDYVVPETVGQYIGVTDKNGKKIFEGDVVEQNWYDHDEPEDSSFGEVVFCEYDCSFSVMDIEKDGIVPLGRCHAYHWEAEVIGNIYDNPEILEV